MATAIYAILFRIVLSGWPKPFGLLLGATVAVVVILVIAFVAARTELSGYVALSLSCAIVLFPGGWWVKSFCLSDSITMHRAVE